MNFKQLETFWWVSKLGSFGGAAARLNATQSTVSARILELENSLNVKLFHRGAKAARLTAQGRLLLPYAEKAIALAEGIYADVGSTGSLNGLIRIGVGEIVALTWLPQMLKHLGEKYPALEVELFVDLTVNLNRMLQAGKVEVILAIGQHPSPLIASRPLGRAMMRWAASPSLMLPARRLTVEELAACRILSLSRDSHQFTQLKTYFGEAKIQPHQIHGCNSISTMIALARIGAGISLLPKVLIENDLSQGTLRIVDAPAPVSHYDFFVMHEQAVTDPAILAISDVAVKTSTFPSK